MRILALRVREVGCFKDPSTLEGMSGSLDVLAGPNEAGKSTLLRALTAVLTEKYTTTSAKLRQWMMPYSGGSPVIEADFAIADKRYRVRKRFFSSPRAELVSIDDGVAARGADAEQLLETVLGTVGGTERLSLIWVEQRDPLLPFEIGRDGAEDLKWLIDRHIKETSEGEATRKIRRAIQGRLEELRSEKQGKPRGPYKLAQEEHTALESERLAAEAAADAARGRLDRLEAVGNELRILQEAGRRGELVRRVEDTHHALNEAKAHIDKRRAAEEELRRLDGDLRFARKDLADLLSKSAELARLEQEGAKAATELASLTVRLSEAECAVGAATSDRLASQEALAKASREVTEARTLEVARRALAERLERALAVQAELKELDRRIQLNRMTPALLEQIEHSDRLLCELDARRNAAATKVVIAYATTATERVRIEGRPLTDGEEVTALGPLSLDVEGLGTIRIIPRGVGDRVALEKESKGLERTLGSLCELAGVADVAGARAKGRELGEFIQLRASASDRLSMIAPDGIAALTERLAALPQSNLPEGREHNGSIEALLERLREAERTHAARLFREREVARDQNGMRVDAARQEAEGKARAARTATLRQELPNRAALEAELEARNSVIQRLHDAAAQAALVLKAHRDAELSPDQLQQVRSGREVAERELASHDAAVRSRDLEIARLTAALDRDAADGVAERAAELQVRAVSAANRVQRFKKEVDALALLNELFRREEASTLDRYVVPLKNQIEPYLVRLLPNSLVSLDERFAAGVLERPGKQEPISALSAGTREQVALVARLGLASLFAEMGEAIPLVLDDALVYADDHRLEAALAALQFASSRHQVIVLTCRRRAFASLGGTWHELQPWRDFRE
jgi:DNA repair exonuclease SbcCD ATPase subunit